MISVSVGRIDEYRRVKLGKIQTTATTSALVRRATCLVVRYYCWGLVVW